ncbi:MAG: FtsX-like permease family protein, partial [Thermoplasmata archaeon]
YMDQNEFFNESIATKLDEYDGLDSIVDGISPMIQSVVSVECNESGQFEPAVTLKAFDPLRDKPFGNFLTSSGEKDGLDIDKTDVVVSRQAAKKLAVKTGETLYVRYMRMVITNITTNTTSMLPMTKEFNVKYIAEKGGKAGTGSAIFIRLDVAQEMFGVEGKVNLIKISNKGDMYSGVTLTNKVNETIHEALKGIDDPSVSRLKVDLVKKRYLELADEVGEQIGRFLTLFSSFSIVAGVILIVNIFVMLAEERKSELGMARAVGMKRKHIMMMFLFEGAVYAVVSAFIGAFVGLLFAYSMITYANSVFKIGDFEGIPFAFDNMSLVQAFCIGVLITFATIFVSSFRISKINIIRAIRDIEEPIIRTVGMKTVALGVFGILSMILLLAGLWNDYTVRLIAPCIMLICASLILRRVWSSERAYTVGGLGVIIYVLYSLLSFFDEVKENGERLFVAAGVMLVLGFVLVIMYNSELVVSAVNMTLGNFPRLRPIVKASTAHPLNKKFRTGMTISMFALVIYTVVMLSVFSSIVNLDVDEIVEREGGGADIFAYSTMPINDLQNAMIIDVTGNITYIKSETLENDIEDFQQMCYLQQIMYVNSTDVLKRITSAVIGIDYKFATNTTYKFDKKLKGYSDEQIWELVFEENSTDVVVDSNFLTRAAGGYGGIGTALKVGDKVLLNTSFGMKEFRIVGTLQESFLNGVMMNKSLVKILYAKNPLAYGNNYFMFKVKEGKSISAVAHALEKDYRKAGLDTIDLRAQVEQSLQMINSMFLLFKVFLGMGLIVGITGLGVITLRAIIERKQEIGIMRAIGFKRSMILNALIVEILIVATLGALVGIIVGVTVSWEIFEVNIDDPTIEFKIPWLDILYIIGITYIASLACTILPAYKASRMPPSQALRRMD